MKKLLNFAILGARKNKHEKALPIGSPRAPTAFEFVCTSNVFRNLLYALINGLSFEVKV